MLMVSSRGMLVNVKACHKAVRTCFSIFSLAKWNDYLTLHSLEVKSLSIGIGNLTVLYVGVAMAERIGRKSGHASITFLWTFAKP